MSLTDLKILTKFIMMRMMFNAFVGGNDIIPDDPDTAEDLDQIHHDEDEDDV